MLRHTVNFLWPKSLCIIIIIAPCLQSSLAKCPSLIWCCNFPDILKCQLRSNKFHYYRINLESYHSLLLLLEKFLRRSRTDVTFQGCFFSDCFMYKSIGKCSFVHRFFEQQWVASLHAVPFEISIPLLWAGELRTVRNATPNVRSRLKNFSSNNT